MASIGEFLIRPMTPRSRSEQRAATQLELFFDLVSVIAIASSTEALHHSISHGDGLVLLPRFMFLFVAIWWPWINYTWFCSGWDNGDGVFKILTGVIMVGYLLFAGGVSHVMETLDFGVGLLGWIIMRAGLIVLWLRAAHGSEVATRKMCYVYAGGLALAQGLWILLYVVTTNGWAGTTEASFLFLGALIFMVEFYVPIAAGRYEDFVYNPEHMVERFGLFTIIVLGEALLSVSLAFADFYQEAFDPAVMSKAAVCFAIVFLMWWIYFIDTKGVENPSNRQLEIWGYAHVFVFFGVVLLGATMAVYIDRLLGQNEVDRGQTLIFVGWPIAIYLSSIWLVREQFHISGRTRYALPVAAVVVLMSVYVGLPLWTVVVILTGALLARVRATPSEELH